METTYRFRFLIYLAAFMLFLSVCFVYAEPLPSAKPSQSHLLFQVASQHAAFITSSTAKPMFDAAALRAAAEPVVSPKVLQQLENATQRHRGLLHGARHAVLAPAPAIAPDQPSVLRITLESQSPALNSR